MIARVLTSSVEVAMALSRLGLPDAAREFLADALAPTAVLLTGLTGDQVSALRRRCDEGSDAPGQELYPRCVVADRRARPGVALLMGRREQLDRVERELHLPLGLAVPAPTELRLKDLTLALGERTLLMGVVNVTPDSFSDGGRYLATEAAVAHGELLVRAGADLLDIGGESTRPGAAQVSEADERQRVLPVIAGLRARVPSTPLSIDTSKAEVARAAVQAGAVLINDVTALQHDPQMVHVAAETGAGLCLMHMQGTPRTMQQAPRYQDLIDEVLTGLTAATQRALSAGVDRRRLLVDPGIGFGKTFGHNLFLLRHLNQLRALGYPVLVGTSRKAFLGALTGGKPAPERAVASAATVAVMAAMGTADVVRVHDVAEAKDAAAVGDAIARAREGGDLFAG